MESSEYVPASAASPQPPPAEQMAARISRADYSNVLHYEENFVKASAVRAESERRKAEMRQQRERFRQRGQMLKLQREMAQEQVKSSLAGCHAETQRLGNESRVQRERLLKERTDWQSQWQQHGRELTAQHTQLRERLKASAEEQRAARTREASELKAALKVLNQQTDDTILAQNVERCTRVKAETSAHVVRASKQTFLEDRWNKADELRESLTRLRARQRRQQQEYLDTAHAIKANANAKHDEALRERQAAQQIFAAELRAEEKRMEAAMKQARDDEVARKRSLHEEMEEAKLVPDTELAKSDEPDAGPLQMFTRFFGFRKRGLGHTMSNTTQ